MVKVNLIFKLLLNFNFGFILEGEVLNLFLRNSMVFVVLFIDVKWGKYYFLVVICCLMSDVRLNKWFYWEIEFIFKIMFIILIKFYYFNYLVLCVFFYICFFSLVFILVNKVIYYSV